MWPQKYGEKHHAYCRSCLGRVRRLAAPALAQPLPAAASYPPIVGTKGVVTTHALSMEMANRIAQGAVEQCRKMGFRTTITVLDASGTLKAFLRDDGTGPHTISLVAGQGLYRHHPGEPFRHLRHLRHRAAIRRWVRP